MGSKYTKRYTEEFKRDAIALVDSLGKTVTAVARELGISSESLRHVLASPPKGRGPSRPPDDAPAAPWAPELSPPQHRPTRRPVQDPARPDPSRPTPPPWPPPCR
ncbi:transposase [Streptomyces avermitilis]|uniref:transposase n=1 Tax=Streptomyces avermitilis TaxID=33903 RepID=UPI0038309817